MAGPVVLWEPRGHWLSWAAFRSTGGRQTSLPQQRQVNARVAGALKGTDSRGVCVFTGGWSHVITQPLTRGLSESFSPRVELLSSAPRPSLSCPEVLPLRGHRTSLVFCAQLLWNTVKQPP